MDLNDVDLRRSISDLGMYFKLVHKLIDLDFDDFLTGHPVVS